MRHAPEELCGCSLHGCFACLSFGIALPTQQGTLLNLKALHHAVNVDIMPSCEHSPLCMPCEYVLHYQVEYAVRHAPRRPLHADGFSVTVGSRNLCLSVGMTASAEGFLYKFCAHARAWLDGFSLLTRHPQLGHDCSVRRQQASRGRQKAKTGSSGKAGKQQT